MFYIDSICWSISSSLYLPQLAGVPFCREKDMQSAWDWYRKLHADICPVIFSSLRKSKGSCFQHGCFVLDFRSIPVYSPIYDFKYLIASSRKHTGIKLPVCTTRGFLPCFWLLLMFLMQFLKWCIPPEMDMFFEFLEQSVSTILFPVSKQWRTVFPVTVFRNDWW